MICFICGHGLRVSNSRPQSSRNQVWRRRTCPNCDAVFTTEEAIDLNKAIIIDGRPFSRDKLFLSLYQACRHRSTAVADAGGLTATVIRRLLLAIDHGTLDRAAVITAANQVLQRFDSAAAVQYTAYHKIDK